MSLRDQHFAHVINSSEVDIAQDFLQPALVNSIGYDRGVGFFSAAWLSLMVDGMIQFAANGGHARILTSPILNAADWEALQKGIEASQDEILRESLQQTVSDLRETMTRDARTALAWLVADGILTFKLAVPINKLTGEFHAKFGIFTDAEGDQISFEGSNNETEQGTIQNYESFKVFPSWKPALASFVQADVQRFERLWNNQDANLRAYELPEAIRQAIIRIRDDDVRPYPVPAHLQAEEPEAYLSLWQHQKDAIDAWEANGRVGLLSMATGSGKTRTALAAAERCPELSLLIVAVPASALVTQWAAELKRHTRLPEPILVYEASSSWQDRLFNAMLAKNSAGWTSPLVIVGTMKSLASERFQTVIEDADIPENTLLIVDEAHNVGAPTYRRILDERFQWRLGLSATPARHFDEIGTSVIRDYFQKTVFIYSMRDALRDGRLTPYEYYIYPAQLSADEYAEYLELTRRIIVARGKTDERITYQSHNQLDGDNKQVEQLLIRRARILKKTASKLQAVERVLQDFKLTRSLVYCADQEQLEEVRTVFKASHLTHAIYIGQTPKDQRSSALDALGKGHIPVVLAIDCLDEGVDLPAVSEAIIIAS